MRVANTFIAHAIGGLLALLGMAATSLYSIAAAWMRAFVIRAIGEGFSVSIRRSEVWTWDRAAERASCIGLGAVG
jgi:hypothetical protein